MTFSLDKWLKILYNIWREGPLLNLVKNLFCNMCSKASRH